jgi:RNA polymerase sigma-70 factor (ECF subfamily)
MPEPMIAPDPANDPEAQAQLADSVGLAMLVVLEQLSPPERLAFVLHDVFGVSFEEIAPIVNRSPEAARQLASRARRRVRVADADAPAKRVDQRLQRRVVNAFLAAGRNGDFDALVKTLDPDVVVHVDFGRARTAAASEVRGADEAARSALLFRAQAPGARSALVNGSPGLVVFSGARPYAILGFEFRGDVISEIYVLADPDRLAAIDFTVLDS